MGAQAAATYYDFPARQTTPWRRSGLVAAAVVAVHVAALAMVLRAAVGSEPLPELPLLSVRLLAAEAPPMAQPAKPQPAPSVAPQRRSRPEPAPVLAAAAPAVAATNFAIAPQPAALPAEPAAAPAPAPVAQAPQPIVGARFDADYLQNPKPAYPLLSRRGGEEGKVVLRVRVSCQGLPLAIEIRQSSSYARLDEAARAAVEKWRFVPARQGAETVESWVLVPLVFKLDT